MPSFAIGSSTWRALAAASLLAGCAEPPAPTAPIASARKSDGPVDSDVAANQFVDDLHQDMLRGYAHLPPLTPVGDPELRKIFVQMNHSDTPHVSAPLRVTVAEPVTIDFASIPVMRPRAGSPAAVPGAVVALGRLVDAGDCAPPESPNAAPVMTIFHVGAGAPVLAPMSHGYVDAAGNLYAVTGRDATRADERGDPREGGSLRSPRPHSSALDAPRATNADWLRLDDARRSGPSLSATRFAGTFDAPAGRAVAREVFDVDAVAVLPGTLYLFSRCDSRCDLPFGSADREDVVEMIGPAASWIGATNDGQALPRAEPFTELTATISPGGSASLLMVASRERIADFRGDAAVDRTAPAFTSFSLEIVWPDGASPTITLFTGPFAGDMASLRDATLAPSCVR